MSVEVLTILLFGSMLVLLLSGLPVVFCMGGVSVLFAFFLLGPQSLGLVASGMYTLMSKFVLLAIPLFIFMATTLEHTGIADDLYTMMHKWFGSLKGGLAIGTIIICTIFAAMSGVSAAALATMGLIALPAMLKRGYDAKLAVGCISAGGGLGQIIPPSVMMIVWALWAEESVGQMFLGGVFPGLLISGLYITYIGVRCFFKGELGPPIPVEERADWKEKLISLRGVIVPVLIILGVLGSIFSGIATPTEAAAVGSLGALLSTVVHRKFSWKHLMEAISSTLRLTSMILWIVIAGMAFAAVFTAMGGQKLIVSTVQELSVNRWVILIGIQIVYLILGCLLDPNAIMILSIPIFVPLIRTLGFDSLWFGVLSVINIELGLITPPFGMNLFYMRAIVPEGISMADIYRSVFPFIILEVLALAVCMVFPQIITFLPNLLIG